MARHGMVIASMKVRIFSRHVALRSFQPLKGTSAQIGENRLGGRTISVLGAGGRIYYYAHLESYAPHIANGDHVTPQTVLGYVGTTGNAAGTPPHLHFGVYSTGSALNPLPLLADRPEEKPSARKADEVRGKKKH